MSSVLIWSKGPVSVSWNKHGPYTVFVETRRDADGISHGITTRHISAAAAKQAARRAVRKLKGEGNEKAVHE